MLFYYCCNIAEVEVLAVSGYGAVKHCPLLELKVRR